MSNDIKVTDGTVLESLNNKVDLDGGNYIGSGLDKIIHEHCGGTGLQMFDTILKDYILTHEESKGLALQGTYVYKIAVAGERYGYPDFYAKCLEEYNEATTTETVNSVTVKVHSNGHKFYDIANKSAIDNSFNSLGTAWYYGVDTTNERIFLPRNNYITSYIANGNKSVSVYGNGMVIGLTDGTNQGCLTNTTIDANFGTSINVPVGTNVSTYGKTSRGIGVVTDASQSGIIGSVNITNTQTGQYLYICVGNTVSDTSWVDVVTQVEGGVKDLEDKKNASIAEIDANAKSYDNLTKRQVTNCITEIPQRIKYTLEDGILTIKVGSVVIYPFGIEDLTAQYPKGAKFLNDNLKVYDTQFVDGKFFVWAEKVNDTSYGKTVSTMANRVLWSNENGTSSSIGLEYCFSGTAAPTGSTTLWYDTTQNIIKRQTDGAGWINYQSFPLILGDYTKEVGFNFIKQVFNGMGYIGSTVWVDKGVKGLIPNGRNEDGSLKNIEFALNSIRLRNDATNANVKYFCIYSTSGLGLGNGYESCKSYIDRNTSKSYQYVEDENNTYVLARTYVEPLCILGDITCDGTKVTSFKPKNVFHAVDVNGLSYLGRPDYTSIISFSSYGNYTPAFDCLFTTSRTGYTDGANITLKVGNTTIFNTMTGTYPGRADKFSLILTKGTTYSITSSGHYTSYIIPLK